MNDTPTPRTDEWEAYYDECYYHMWRLRRKTERAWNDEYHIYTGDEAKGLCDLLNNLEAKLTVVTEQRDEARDDAERWKFSSDAMESAEEEQARRADENREWALKAERERDEARGQRDRLAEALQSIKCELGVPQPEYPSPVANAYWIADEALQSLNQPEL